MTGWSTWSRPPTAGGPPPSTWSRAPTTPSGSTAPPTAPTPAAPCSPTASTAPHKPWIRPPGSGPIRTGRARTCSAQSSTSYTWAPSPPRAPWTAPSPGSITWPSWASTSSSSCPWPPSPAEPGGATTGWACGPSTRPTGAPRRSCASSTPPTAPASACASTSSTTTWARRATTSASSAPTSPPPITPPGARPSTTTTTAVIRYAPSSSTRPCAGYATSTSTPCAWTPSTRSRMTPQPPTLHRRTSWPSSPTPWPPCPPSWAAP